MQRQLVFRYIRSRALFVGVGIYFLVSTLLKALTGIDICIPCLWHTFFDFHCPGCGLTRAFIELLKFNPRGAFGQNPLIFLVLPAILFFSYQDVSTYFRKRI
ncbi:MAG: DUF2752 domain-containing protein [Flavobacteriia bacterium]|nr:DUF2752 domain-containing protein [Flavobacteriia bacterium]